MISILLYNVVLSLGIHVSIKCIVVESITRIGWW